MATPASDPAVAQAVGDEYVDEFGIKDVLGSGTTGALGAGGRYYLVWRQYWRH
ncbi:hypothetical protein AB0O82_29850 [Kitasatospora sp. NPDC088264]|uniref:hypothetical protein n=1 Tax=Kitasatospora sp. NPDC088264 TaxID=3155296 RepID=UPI00341F52C7